MRAPFQVLIIPFRANSTKLEFAVLKRSSPEYWQFVSGGGEDDESPIQAATRETREEISIDANDRLIELTSMTTIPKNCFSSSNCWEKDILVVPEHSFAINVGKSQLSLSPEHTELHWLSYHEAYNQLKWDSNRTALWELRERLRNKMF